jgi:DNA-binding MarR family transcriptional regulator
LHKNIIDVIVQKNGSKRHCMDNLAHKCELYLNETLGLTVTLTAATACADLPFYLQSAFVLYELQLPGLDCLIAIPQENAEHSPATIKKYFQQIQDACSREVIYLTDSISPHNRKRLVEHRISFVVPGNQLYLPLLGVDFREYFKKARTKVSKVSPATQVVILFVLAHDIAATYTPLSLSRLLGYTPMTMTRALDELETVGFGEISNVGKERVLRFTEDKQTLWAMVQTVLRTPIKRRLWAKYDPANNCHYVQSGLTALAHYSLLAEPKQPVFAIGQDNWKKLANQADVTELPYADNNACQVELWSYDPCLLTQNGIADNLSLYLSLKDDNDERVAAALEEMMKGMTW